MQASLAPLSRTRVASSRALVAYFVLAYAVSWAIEISIVLSVRGMIPFEVPLWIHYLASCGPLVAAIVVAAVYEGRQGVKKLFAGLAIWRVGPGYAFFAIVLPFLLFALAVVASRIMQGAWPNLGLLAEVDYLPRLGVPLALGLWLLTFGLAEEVGWRGFALPRLQANRSALSASVIIGLLWAGWHFPAFFYRDTYIAMGLWLGYPMLAFSVVTASIVLTWLFNGTKGSLLMVVLFHGLFDFFSVSAAGGPAAATVMSVPLVLWMVFVIWRYGPENLAPAQKVVA